MSEGAYKRLLAWADGNGHHLDVAKVTAGSAYVWTISVHVTSPVSFTASGRGADVDVAAASVIIDLEAVGVTIP